MLQGLGKAMNFEVKPKMSYKDLKNMNATDKDQIMNYIMAKDQ